jgi:formate dehydrogenase subunit gamma
MTDGTVASRTEEVARLAVAAHRELRGPLLPVLHAVQYELGYVPADAVPVIAAELNLSRADVHGVLTFYSDLRTEPPARTVVQVCRAEACQAVGADDLLARTGERLDRAITAGDVAVEPVFCLGNCALGPSALVDGRVVGRLSADRLAALVAEAGR